MAKKSDIEIDLSVTGLAAVRAAFAGVQRSGVDAGKKVEKATADTEKGFISLRGTIGRTTTGIRGMGTALRAVGTIGVAGVVGGAAAMAGAYAKARTEIETTATRLAEMSNAATAAGVDDVRDLGGFQHAIEQIGGSADDARSILRELYKTAFDARAGDESAIEKLANMGGHWEDLIDQNGDMRDTVDMVSRMADNAARYADEIDILRAAQEIAGDAGVHLARIMSDGSGEIERQIGDYRRLTDIRNGDITLSREYVKALSAEKYAREGLGNAFFRGYGEGAITAKGLGVDAMIDAREQAERLGVSMSALSLSSMPLLIAASERGAQGLEELSNFLRTGETDAPWIIAVQSGLEKVEGAAIAVGDGFVAMQNGYRAAVDYAENHVIPALGTTLVGAIEDVIGLISTGETEAPWLQSIVEKVDGFMERMDRVLGVLGAIQDMIFGFADMVSEGLNAAFGLDVSSTAVVAGLVLFSSTLGKIPGLIKGLSGMIGGLVSGVGALVSKIDAVGAAADAADAKVSKGGKMAAGAKALGGVALVAGTYAAVSSTRDLDAEMQAMAPRVNALAAEHGEEYAAAYMLAFLERVPQEFKTASWINSAASLVGLGPDFEKAIADAESIIAQSGEGASDVVRAGFIQAFKDYGWGIDPKGTLDIAAGISISGAELSAGVLADLGAIDATINVSAVQGLDDAINAALSNAASSASPAPLDLGPAAAASAPGAGLAPVTINIGGQSVSGLYGSADAISDLEKAAYQTRRGRV